MNYILYFFISFSLILPTFSFSNTEESETTSYACQIKSQDCLNELNNVLLNKEDNRSIYQYCQITSDNFKLCCEDPLNCSESWGKDMAQNLKTE